MLCAVRTDDLAAMPLPRSTKRNPAVDWAALDDVIFGCANQAGEDNRNVARMAALLAGFPFAVPGVTVNRLCGSGLDAVAIAARMIRSGEAELLVAGGVESMSRAPYVLSKADAAFTRNQQMYDTTIGWRFVNPLIKHQYGIDSMPETGENVAADFEVSRADQDAFALRSQQRALRAQARRHAGRGDRAGGLPAKKGDRDGRRARRASARDQPRGAREAADAVPRRRHRDRRQRLGRQRRRLRAAARERARRASATA